MNPNDNHAQVSQFIAACCGPQQHSPEWHTARRFTVGGSSLSTIQGINPYATIYSFIAERIRPTAFGSTVTRWGNLFEDVIKKIVERLFECTVHGENIYISGTQGTSFSPDGLAVIDDRITLVEFKCPFARIPTKTPPKYYVPQVKMGLDMIPITDRGLLVEGVFRRCSYASLGFNTKIDLTLVAKQPTNLPICCGVICVYSKTLAPQMKKYNDAHTIGDKSNNYRTVDLGTIDVASFGQILEGFVDGPLEVSYGPIYWNAAELCDAQRAGLAKQAAATCAANGWINYGIIPWKLFQLEHHWITKEPDYLAPWIPKIIEITDFLHKCHAADPSHRDNMLTSFMNRGGEGFIDV